MSKIAQKIVDAVNRAREIYRRSRKAAVAVVGLAALLLGPDSQVYIDIVAILTAAGVYARTNE